MSDSLVKVDIELLRQHPELPDPADILARFAEHHAQSEARRKAHDELMQSDSNLVLEDFGALAASALGGSENHENILDEEAPAYAEEPSNNGDTLPEHEAASEGQPADDPTHDSEEASSETAEPADEDVEPANEADEADSADDATETSDSLTAEPTLEPEPEPEAAAEVAPKKRTRKRKSKKKKS